MTVYIINILLILIYAFIFKASLEYKERRIGEKNLRLNYGRNISSLIGIQLFLLSTLKDYSVGIDMSNYRKGFNTIGSLNWDKLSLFNWEIGYVFLNKLVSLITIDFRAVIFIVGGIIVILLSRYIYTESRIPWLSFYLFITMDFFSFTLSGYRQAIAIMITLYSIKHIRGRNAIKFILVILIASLFHQSALIFIIVYPISKINITKNYLIIISIISVFIFIYGNKLANIFVSVYSRNQIIVSGRGYSMFLVLFMITIVGLILYKYDRNIDSDIKLLCHLMILSTFMQIISLNLSIFVRVVSYFSIHMITFIPNILNTISSRHLKNVSIILIITLSSVFYFYILAQNPSGTVPYKFMW